MNGTTTGALPGATSGAPAEADAGGATRGLRTLAWLALPVLGLALFEAWNARAYGESLLLRAWRGSGELRATVDQPLWATAFATCTFLGGSLASVVILAPAWLGLRGTVTWACVAIGAWFLLRASQLDGATVFHFDPAAARLVKPQAAVCLAGAGIVLELVVHELWTRRDRVSLVLAAWSLGTLAFALLVNWGVNARTLLPLVPAVAILAARRLEHASTPRWLVPAALATGLALALLVALGEQELARSQRDAARELVARARRENRAPYVQGHWGFQHYAEQAGAVSLTVDGPLPPKGSAVILPARNTGVWGLPRPAIGRTEGIVRPLSLPLTTFGWATGASFHAHTMGPLPFALNRGSTDEYAYVIVP